MPRATVLVDGRPLAFDDVLAVAQHRAEVRLDPAVTDRMAAARRVVDAAVADNRVVYGVTTGFGAQGHSGVRPVVVCREATSTVSRWRSRWTSWRSP